MDSFYLIHARYTEIRITHQREKKEERRSPKQRETERLKWWEKKKRFSTLSLSLFSSLSLPSRQFAATLVFTRFEMRPSKDVSLTRFYAQRRDDTRIILRINISFRVSNPNFVERFLSPLFFLSVLLHSEREKRAFALRALCLGEYTHYIEENVDKIRNEIEQGERPLVPPETPVDFSLVTLRGGAIVGLPNGNADRPIRRTRRARSWGGFSHQPTVVRFRWRRL